MDLRIGENVKRLRLAKGITQEQLAEVLNVSSVAVSKWERGETMPDIALLPKLAFYFQTTIDELMSYDACAVELEIQSFLETHGKAAETYDLAKCRRLSAEAYERYPNDYRVMELYMWDLAGGYADNDLPAISEHSAEIESLCERILSGCSDAFIRRDAYVMKGKLLHAAGRTAEALALYQKELPDWYQTAGQKSEQLFSKDTEEFAALLRRNMTELGRFVLNKKSKELWFCTEGSVSEKTDKAVAFCEALGRLEPFFPDGSLPGLISYFAGDFIAKLNCGKGNDASIKRLKPFLLQ